MTDTGTLFLSQQDVIDAGATDVDWVGGVLEQVFKLHEQQAFTAPQAVSSSGPSALMWQIASLVCQRTWARPSTGRA